MREELNIRQAKMYRRQLLGTASLVAIALHSGDVRAAASERPAIWIEAGWQAERITGKDESFSPSFAGDLTDAGFPSPVRLEYPSPYGVGAEGKLSLQPQGSNWVLAVSARYGRMTGKKSEHQQTSPEPIHFLAKPSATPATFIPAVRAYSDVKTSNEETHTIVDFAVGRDFGLGLFSPNSTSNFNLGVRYAQFHSRSSNVFGADPRYDIHFKYVPRIHGSFPTYKSYHLDKATEYSARSFHGVGPTIEWNASTPLMGDAEEGELTIDWGVNAALLFGRQKANIQHQTVVAHHYGNFFSPSTEVTNNAPPPRNRSRSVTVPNLGGFAGVSYKFTSAKISVGYRADQFFGAVDSGIDIHKSRDVGFFGPFATVSIGLGG